MLANIHSILASKSCCAYLNDIHDVGLPTQFLFNVGPELRLIASSMPVNRVRRWLNSRPTLNNDPTHDYSTPAATATTGRLTNFNVGLTLAQQQPSILYTWLLSGNCYTGDTFIQNGHYPDNTIHWPNCEIMLGNDGVFF